MIPEPDDFDPDSALERIRELVKPWTEIAELLELQEVVAALDDHIVRSGGTGMPQDWRYEPGVHFERLMSRQPRRTSRSERRRG